MPFKHKRKIITDPKEIEALERETEILAASYLRGEITREQYEEALEKLNLYLDFRQLAVELQVA